MVWQHVTNANYTMTYCNTNWTYHVATIQLLKDMIRDSNLPKLICMLPAPGPCTLVVTKRNTLILTKMVRLQIFKNKSPCTDTEYLISLWEEEMTLFLYHCRGSSIGGCLNAEIGTSCQSSYLADELLWDFSSWYSMLGRWCWVSLKLPLWKRPTDPLDWHNNNTNFLWYMCQRNSTYPWASSSLSMFHLRNIDKMGHIITQVINI